ncbi:MopE-related protein [Aestuariivivens insulae]|uniref:MopE-related protein n=1 Tax=Aestuariivivens insulae TaxID=1621988 RepID=UPI001F55F897|nr:MopE-related protein [Aestuariivivens insulae]
MNKIAFIGLVLVSLWSHAQNCDSNTNIGSFEAQNTGDTEQITSTIYAGEYITVTNILPAEYTFTSNYLGSTDYITIRNDDGSTVLVEGDSPLNYTFQSSDIPTGEIRVIIHLSNSCDSDSNTHTVNLLKVPTCYKPENPKVDYLSNKQLDFHWDAPSSGPIPLDYDWEIGLSGFTPGTGNHIVNGSTGGATTASSGENALTTSTAYQVAIRSNCGSGDYSVWLVTGTITTLSSDPPTNDYCSGAISVIQETGKADAASATGIVGSVLGGAGTNQDAEICDTNSANARDDVWYSFLAQATEVTITLEPMFNGRLSLFSGDCNALTLLDCSDANGGLAPTTEEMTYSGFVIGTTYYFRVYSQGFSASNPNFTLKLWSTAVTTDGDMDGYSDEVDCDDTESMVYPGAPELCDGLDNDCDGVVPSDEIDNDGDSYSECEGDCDDTDDTVYPNAPELCDNKDNDCANGVDDGLVFEDYYTDADGDGYGDATDAPESSCSVVSGKVTNNLDCDDGNANINPGATEVAGNDIDEDCDGSYLRYVDADGDGYGSTTTVSSSMATPDTGESNDGTDCDDTNVNINPGATEVAGNDIDEDCDGSYLRYVDNDGDGYGSTTTVSSSTATPDTGESNISSDCDDGNANINPGAKEVAGNDIDEDCDGSYLRYVDADGDGYGSTTTVSSSTATPDTGESNDSTDCDDTNLNINPGATEVAGNDIDEDCDGSYLRYVDNDGDGYGSTTTVSSSTDTPDTGESNESTDCDDTNVNINPGATEVAGNDIDEDCDGSYLRYVDNDGDGYGSTTTVSSSTDTPDTGESNESTDCDDTNVNINPGATEVAGNDIDEDCDGSYLRYVDNDGDGYGSTTTVSSSTDTPDTGESNDNTDCDDGNANINPGATEVAGNDIDEDCDGSYLRYVDADGDGYGSTTTVSSSTATPDTGESNDSTDCDDTNVNINPGATEVAGNDIDEDCDGSYLRYVDTDGDGYGSTTTVSSSTATPDTGESNDSSDCDDGNANINPGAMEVAGNDIDEDCDGSYLRYVDADGDGYGSTTTVSSSTATPNTGESNDSTDCDDTNVNINPGATEVAGNDIDEDCDGSYLRYVDNDGDGYGSTTTVSSNTATPDTGESNDSTDCDDTNVNINPGATEVAGNDIDEDCDGSYLRYVDNDGDGYGSTTTVSSSTATPDTGESNDSTDCDDTNVNINPGATEVAGNDIDEDCDGSYLRYVDNDGDGYGSTTTVSSSTATPDTGESNISSDCDDGNANINPGATEVAGNDIDEDCDGSYLRYVDADGDGYGSTTTVSSSAATPSAGESNDNTDCDDMDADVNPGQVEILDNGKDDDCNLATLDSSADIDDDGDGFTENEGDCDDTKAAIYPNAPELCDGLDNDCDGVVPSGEIDNDGDNYSECEGDCDDTDDTVYPNAPELCDNKDNDCANGVDDGLVFEDYYADADGDGYGDATDAPESSCSAVSGKVTNNLDCDDTNVNINPGATEVAGNDIDEDCDGNYLRYVDADADGYGSTTTVFSNMATPDTGESNDNTDCDDMDADVNPGQVEILDNGKDDDCNLATLDSSADIDDDGDGFTENEGDCDDTKSAIYPNAPELCDGLDNDCDGVVPSGEIDNDGDNYSECEGDCDDTDDTVYPNAPELCDNKDNDCANGVDDGLVFEDYYTDADGDGYGDATDAPESSCSAVSGKVTNKLDCDDTNVNINPGAMEIAGNDIDEDCDGSYLRYVDADGDGYGSTTTVSSTTTTPDTGESNDNTDCDDMDADVNPGQVEILDNGKDDDCNLATLDSSADIDDDGDGFTENEGDCDDTKSAIYPNAPELCDGLDNDCDGVVPSGEIDNDGDNYSECEGDCDDTDDTVYPNAPELCDNKDNDCTNGVDDGLVFEDYYTDADGDGYGDATDIPESSCGAVSSKVTNNLDCDDSDIMINPDASELCNGIDDNCDGETDEGFVDTDGDGVADCIDNCPTVNNTNQADADNDGVGDACEGLRVDDLTLKDIWVKPNPFNATIEIQLPSSFNDELFAITLFDLRGRLIVDQEKICVKGSIALNGLEAFEQGVYLLKIRAMDNKHYFKRMVKY